MVFNKNSNYSIINARCNHIQFKMGAVTQTRYKITIHFYSINVSLITPVGLHNFTRGKSVCFPPFGALYRGQSPPAP
jgi:hypothetical protein